MSSFQPSGHEKENKRRRKVAKREQATGGFHRQADVARAERKGKQPMSEEEEEVVVGPGTYCPPRNVIQLILNPRILSGILYDEASYMPGPRCRRSPPSREQAGRRVIRRRGRRVGVVRVGTAAPVRPRASVPA